MVGICPSCRKDFQLMHQLATFLFGMGAGISHHKLFQRVVLLICRLMAVKSHYLSIQLIYPPVKGCDDVLRFLLKTALKVNLIGCSYILLTDYPACQGDRISIYAMVFLEAIFFSVLGCSLTICNGKDDAPFRAIGLKLVDEVRYHRIQQPDLIFLNDACLHFLQLFFCLSEAMDIIMAGIT